MTGVQTCALPIYTFSLNTTSGSLYQAEPVTSGDTWTLEAGQIIVVEAANSLQFTSSGGGGTLVANAYGAKHVA